MSNWFSKLRLNLRRFVFVSVAAYASTAATMAAAVDCETLAAQAGARAGIPNALLPSIARIESGKKQGELGVRAWPWTLNQAGKGMYFETRDDALAYLKKAVASGVTNIDVGCMQINYRWHGDQFGSLEEMMDPVLNTRYSAKFLSDLFRRHKSWEIATRHYHSPKEERGKWYQGKVASVMQRILGEAPVRLASAETSEMTTATSTQFIQSQSGQTKRAQPVRRSVLAGSPGGALIAVRPSVKAVRGVQNDYASLIPSTGPLVFSASVPGNVTGFVGRGNSSATRMAKIDQFRQQFSN